MSSPVPEVETCTAAKHGTEQAWREGCRCPGAIKRHRKRLDKRLAAPAAVDGNGNCIADKHGSEYAFRQHGCRCDAAWRDEKRRQAANRERERKRRGYAYRWRGPESRVNRVSVLLAMAGFVDGTTVTERWLAARTLLTRGHRSGMGLMTKTEVAERLGYSESKGLDPMFKRIDRLREQRTERRLADVKDKAARVARAVKRRGDTA